MLQMKWNNNEKTHPKAKPEQTQKNKKQKVKPQISARDSKRGLRFKRPLTHFSLKIMEITHFGTNFEPFSEWKESSKYD